MNQTNNTGKLIGLGALVVALCLAGYLLLAKPAVPAPNPGDTLPEGTPIEEQPATPDLPVSTAPASRYKDGTYSAEGNYVSPGGPEKIDVTLTVKGDMVTAATVKNDPQNPTTKQFQAKFLSGYEALVVGKSLDEVALTKVSGSSLTPKGWNDAVAEIKTEAEA